MLWQCAWIAKRRSLHKTADATQRGPLMIGSQVMSCPTIFIPRKLRPAPNAPSNTSGVIRVQG